MISLHGTVPVSSDASFAEQSQFREFCNLVSHLVERMTGSCKRQIGCILCSRDTLLQNEKLNWFHYILPLRYIHPVLLQVTSLRARFLVFFSIETNRTINIRIAWMRANQMKLLKPNLTHNVFGFQIYERARVREQGDAELCRERWSKWETWNVVNL